ARSRRPGARREARGEVPTTPAAWARDLALGARFAVGGGREGWTRTFLTALGVGLGVAVLLVAAAVPNILTARGDRASARDDFTYGRVVEPGATTIVTGRVDTVYRDHGIYGRLIHADGDRPVLPPGLSRPPAPGEMVVSPELAKLLASPDGTLLRERLPYRIAGTIGDPGLLGPRELAYYAGSDVLVPGRHATRTDHIGSRRLLDPLDPFLTLLVVVAFVVLLMPVLVLIATAVRFGGEQRDRRLAALRLVGADAQMTRRIAAGETLFAALLGLCAGVGLFFGGRSFVDTVELWRISVFGSDLAPTPVLTILVVVGVPTLAVAVTLFTLRRVAIEPLGVVRQAGTAGRRLWWRLLPPFAGLALLSPMIDGLEPAAAVSEPKIAAGVVLLLVGVTALLPLLVEAVVRRLHGGPLPFQLAIRRTQLDSGAAARTVNGITVAVAGAIAVQMLFAGLASRYTHETGDSRDRVDLRISRDYVDEARQSEDLAALWATPGVVAARTFVLGHARRPGTEEAGAFVVVADCATLGQSVETPGCGPGSVYLSGDRNNQDPLTGGVYLPAPGERVDLATGESEAGPLPPRLWTVPSTALDTRPVPDSATPFALGVFATPEALTPTDLGEAVTELMAKLDPADRDAVERVRNLAARMDPLRSAEFYEGSVREPRLTNIERGLFIGSTVVLLLIGASMLVTVVEELRERRKLLAALVAVGTRRSTLGLSVLWQTALPVTLGLALAVAGGLGLGAILLKMAGLPPAVSWTTIAWTVGTGGGVVLLVTLSSLPVLWRMMRSDGLRTE
ncbi:FtsX-like permease family protein, partial [Streptomyces sp. CBMA156]